MRFAPKLRFLWLIILLITISSFSLAQENDLSDEDSPEVTARVARISFIRGDVQVKRLGENDWEDASLNLPLVEGDQISTSENARVEIQFDSQNFLRLAENSSLKITTLRDEGIAVTMAQGTLSLRVFEFEKDKGFFEIDAPQTTVSIQQAGLYRIDASGTSDEVRVTATEGGEARIYSDSSGFTLRNGRSATIFLTNDRLGEWETADAARYSDEWDNWVAERDNKLARLLKDSYYDKYYDRDIYGAEELNNYGNWSDSDDYGKIWRPNYSSISSYSNWSPYRYGHWRWVNPFGWTWVNDEPWGWATYHHGRWVNDNRGWFWTPYSYHRPKRSYWKPALVAIFNINNDICWYPLSHRDRYNDYNRNYRKNNDRNFGNYRNDRNYNRPDFRRLPENSIVGIRSDEFGRRRNNVRSISHQIARQTLEQRPNEIAQLPKFEERRREFRQDSSFRRSQPSNQIRTGVTERQAGVELDKRLQNERFRGNRQQNTRIRQPENSTNEVQRETENNNSRRNERTRQPQIFNNGGQNGIENNDSRRNERTERRNQNDETRNQPQERKIIPTPYYRQFPPVNPQPTPRNDNNSERRNAERQPRNNTEQRPVYVPQNNNSTENNQRSRPREDNSEENNRRSRTREKEAENNNQNNVRQENRPVYVPRNNDENRRSAPPPRSESPQPRPQPQPRQERREEPRREQPRQEQRREEPRVERKREEPRQEQRKVEQRREPPRQEPPRQKETPREERRSAPPPRRSEMKRQDPKDN